MNLKRDVRPVTYLKNHAAEVLRSVCEDGRTMLITQNGEAKAVVMDAEQYDHWQQALAMLKLISLGETGGPLDRTYSSAEVFDEAEAIVNQSQRHGR